MEQGHAGGTSDALVQEWQRGGSQGQIWRPG